MNLLEFNHNILTTNLNPIMVDRQNFCEVLSTRNMLDTIFYTREVFHGDGFGMPFLADDTGGGYSLGLVNHFLRALKNKAPASKLRGESSLNHYRVSFGDKGWDHS